MDFIIDKVSEDSYYVNLLLGLPQLLGNHVEIKKQIVALIQYGRFIFRYVQTFKCPK